MQGEAWEVAFVGEVRECGEVSLEDDRGGHAWDAGGEAYKPGGWVYGGLEDPWE